MGALVAVTTGVGLTSVGSLGAAAADAPFSFAEETALPTSCADLLDGVAVSIRNDTAGPQTINVSLGSISDSSGKPRGPASVCGGLTREITSPAPTIEDGQQVPSKVDPGAEAVVTLRATSVPSGGTETYTTRLAVFADAGSVARREVEISETKPAGVSAVPLIDSISTAHHRHSPFDDWIVWVPVDMPASKTPFLEPGEAVGAVSGEGGTAAVTYGAEGLDELTAETALVPLHIAKVGAGSYSGSVDLVPEDPEAGTVEMSVTAKHWWPFCAFFLMVGIGVALFIQWRNGNEGVRARLLQRVRDTTALRNDAQDRLHGAAGLRPWGAFNVPDDRLTPLQEGLEAEIGSRTKRRTITIDQKIIDDLGGKIDALEKKLQSFDSIIASAPLLDTALDELEAGRPKGLPPLRGSDLNRREPRLQAVATQLLTGSSLPVDVLVERATAIAGMSGTVRALSERERALAHYWVLAHELEQALGSDRAEVVALVKRLEGIRHALWDADSKDVLEDADEDFETVRDTIDDLWPALPVAEPPKHVSFSPPIMRFLVNSALFEDDASIEELLPADARILGRSGDMVLIETELPATGEPWGAVPGVAVSLPDSGAPPPPPPVPPPSPRLTDAEADRVIVAARRTQWLVVAISLVVALVTGLTALYVGKTWGTLWDYIAAVAWGLGVQATLVVLAGAITGLGAVGALRHGLGQPKL